MLAEKELLSSRKLGGEAPLLLAMIIINRVYMQHSNSCALEKLRIAGRAQDWRSALLLQS